METDQVKCILSYICAKYGRRRSFFDVLDCSGLDTVKINKYPALLIVNTMPIPYEGHWCAFYIPHRRGALEFFDAFDKDPAMYNDEFARFIQKHGGYKQMPRSIQCYDSSACGPHCLRYLCNRLRGKTIYQIYLNVFKPGCRKNDKISYDFVKKIVISLPKRYKQLYF